MTALSKSHNNFLGNFRLSHWWTLGGLDVISMAERIASWVMALHLHLGKFNWILGASMTQQLLPSYIWQKTVALILVMEWLFPSLVVLYPPLVVVICCNFWCHFCCCLSATNGAFSSAIFLNAFFQLFQWYRLFRLGTLWVFGDRLCDSFGIIYNCIFGRHNWGGEILFLGK